MRKRSLPPHLNICMIARKFPLRGRAAEYSFLWPIARGLAQRGHQVTVLASEPGEGTEHLVRDGVHTYYLSESHKKDSFYSFPKAARLKFSELHRTQPFHLVHSVDSSGLSIARYKAEFGVAVAFDVRATQVAQLFAILAMSQETLGSLILTSLAVAYKHVRTYWGGDRGLLKAADGVFVTSPQERLTLERYYWYPDSKIHTVPYGIEIGSLTPREESKALRDSLKIPEDGQVITTITDMSEMREISCMLEAFEAVVIKKPDSRLVIVGQGPKKHQIERKVYDLALGNKVILTGAIPSTEVGHYIDLCDVFVNLSSRTTGFEPSILEAMAQKKVIVGSEVSALASIVEDGVDGFLVRPADVNSISRLLLEIFTGQISTSDIGDRARRKVIDLFDTQRMVEQTTKAYFQILFQTKLYKKST